MPYLLFPIALSAGLLLVPFVRWLSFRTGKVSQPRSDRWHRQPTPRLGGVGMFGAWAIALLIFAALGGAQALLERWPLLLAAVVMFILGFYDDLREVTPPVKLVAQLAAALLVILAGGLVIRFFPWPVANILLTFFWLIGITNAVNLLDNMDGIAAGVALIASLFLAAYFYQLGDSGLLALTLALAGGVLGFLIFNFPPARIFMGDGGSMFLGFTLATLAIARSTQASNVAAILGVPVLLFLAPILDTTMVTVTRLLRGQSPAQGGTDHSTHRLVAFGLSGRQVALVVYGVAILGGLAGAALEALRYELSLVLVPPVIIVLSLLTAYLGRLKVVSSQPRQAAPEGLSRVLKTLTYRQRLFEMLLDLGLIGISYYVAYWVIYGRDMTSISMALFLHSWPLALIGGYLAFYLSGVYRMIWGHWGARELARQGLAALAAAIIVALGTALDRQSVYPPSVFVLHAIFLFVGLAGSRALFAVLDVLAGISAQRRQAAAGESHRVLIYGASEAGVQALRWLEQSPDLCLQAVAFLDEDAGLWQRRMEGLTVVGGAQQAAQCLQERAAVGILLAVIPETETLVSLRLACRAQGAWLKMIRIELEEI